MRRAVAKLLAIVLYIVPLAASSQAWLPDRDKREGAGIRLGERLIFHPGTAIEGGYDTNPLRVDEDPNGAARMRLSGYLDLATRDPERRIEDSTVESPTPPKVDFRFGLAGYYDFFFDRDPVGSADEQDDFGIDSHLNLTLFPNRPVTATANVIYARTLQPYESPAERHARHTIDPNLSLRVTPGGGTLSFKLSYGAMFLVYEELSVASINNKVTQNIELETSWKVFPRTALMSKVQYSPVYYLGTRGENRISNPVRGQLGIRGLLTNRFGISLFAGYGASFYSEGDDFDGLIASGELMFFPTPFSNIRIGGGRDFVDSFYANFYTKSGGYIRYDHMFGGVFLLSFKTDVYYHSYSYLSYYPPGSYYAMEQDFTNRADLWVSSTLLLEYRITEWLSAMISGEYESVISDFYYVNTWANDPVKYHKFEVMGGVRVHY